MIKIQNNEIEVLDPKMQGEGAEAKNGTLVKKFGKKRNTGFGMKRSTRFEKIYLGIIFFLMYLPVAVVIIFSFNESKLPVRLTGFSFQWYEKLFADSAMMEALVNSILGMVLMAFFYMLNLPFGMLTLLIGHTVFCIPYILMEVKARLVGLDPSLEEAARDLGATSMRAFLDVTLPLIMPAVASGSLLAFAMSMDDVVISIFINGPRLSTLPIKVYTQIKTGVTPEINALCTIMLAFTVVILLVYSLIKKLKRKYK